MSKIMVVVSDDAIFVIEDIDSPSWILTDKCYPAWLPDEKRAALYEIMSDPDANRDKYPHWFRVLTFTRQKDSIRTAWNYLHNGI
jgi:hypothetical protein